MPDSPIKYNSQIEKDEHDDSANIGGKRSILYGWNSSTLQYERILSASGVLQTSGSGGTGGGGGAATIADGADVAEGTTTDAAVTTNTAGTVSGKLRGLVAIFADVWDSTVHRLAVYVKDITATGTITTTENVEITLNGTSVVGMQLTGAFGGTIIPQATIDGTNWFTVNVLSVPSSGLQQSIGNAGNYVANVSGFKKFRLLGNTVNTATATISMQASNGDSGLIMNNNPFSVNVSNFAIGTFGNQDTTAANLTSSMQWAGMFVYDSVADKWPRLRGDATNGAYVNVTKMPNSSSATLAQVASSATSVTLKTSNANRKALIVVNDSTQVLYVKLGGTASPTSYTYKLAAGDQLELPQPIYTGTVDGIWASANGNAYVTEY